MESRVNVRTHRWMSVSDKELLYLIISNTNGEKVIINVGEKTFTEVEKVLESENVMKVEEEYFYGKNPSEDIKAPAEDNENLTGSPAKKIKKGGKDE